MATTFCGLEIVSEDPKSPIVKSAGIASTVVRRYRVRSASHNSALALVEGLAPVSETVGSIPLQAPREIDLDPEDPETFTATVTYKHAGRDEQTKDELVEIGDEKVSGSFSGRSAHITEALSQTKYGTNAREVGKSVNVNYDGEVEGVDVNERTGSFTVETIISEATGTNSWFKARFEQIWTLNNADFRSWSSGCVALVGMDYRQRSDGNWEIAYHFEIIPSETVTSIAGVALGGSVFKEGWQYVWAMYRKKEDTATKRIEPEAIGVYIADLYPSSNFADLGIST